MPDWNFVFFGHEVSYAPWEAIKELENVTWFDQADMDVVAEAMCEADVGIIPYIQDRWIRNSYPLKALEYISCGLPVASVPIDALEQFSEDISFFTNAEELKAVLTSLACQVDEGADKRREEISRSNSYDARFEQMTSGLSAAIELGIATVEKLNICVLYDSFGSMHVSCIKEHLNSFQKYSRHNVVYVPATDQFWKSSRVEKNAFFDFSQFDVVLINYSVRTSVTGHLDDSILKCLVEYQGIKILFVQDEYEGIESTLNIWTLLVSTSCIRACQFLMFIRFIQKSGFLMSNSYQHLLDTFPRSVNLKSIK